MFGNNTNADETTPEENEGMEAPVTPETPAEETPTEGEGMDTPTEGGDTTPDDTTPVV